MSLIFSLGLASAVLMVATVRIALKTRRRPVTSGHTLPGEVAEVVEVVGDDGRQWVRLQGELWRADSAAPLRPGQKVKIVGRRGLVLDVDPEVSQQQGE